MSRLRALIDRGTFAAHRLRALVRPPLAPTANYFVASVSPLELPSDSSVRRSKPRPVEHQDANYARDFDDSFIFYDVFEAEDRLLAIGPPLRNLADYITPECLSVDGRAANPTATSLLNAERVTIPGRGHRLTVDAATIGRRLEATVQPAHTDIFAGRKVLLTISRDNRLEWIVDWIDFHVRAHGADAVLIYDNSSQTYTPADLLDWIRRVPNLKAAVVVPWPFKFGPGGTADGNYWDSAFAQPSMYEHARHRFLSRAAALVNADIDELIVTEDGRSLFEHLRNSPTGAVIYEGRWVTPARRGLHFGPGSHRDFRYLLAGEPPYLDKWTCDPTRIPADIQLGIHTFSGDFAATRDPAIAFRHFRAISNNWKYNRVRGRRRYRPGRHIVDEPLVRTMRDIGWLD